MNQNASNVKGAPAVAVQRLVRRQFDGCTLILADCLDVLPIEADVLVTDPPYGANNASGWNGLHGKCKIANDESTALRDAILAAWGDKPAIVFGSWRMARPAATKAVLIWDKGGHSGMGDLSFRGQFCDYQRHMIAKKRTAIGEIVQQGGTGGNAKKLWPDHLIDCETYQFPLARILGFFSYEPRSNEQPKS